MRLVYAIRSKADITLGSFSIEPGGPIPQTGDVLEYFDEDENRQKGRIGTREFFYTKPINGTGELAMIVFKLE